MSRTTVRVEITRPNFCIDMKGETNSNIRALGAVLIAICGATLTCAAPMPQDTWTFYGKKLAVIDSQQKRGVAIGGGSIYVGVASGTAVTSIQKFTLAGAYVSTLSTSFSDVTGMASDGSGNLYVFDRAASSLKSFDSAGNLLWTTGSAGTAPEQFSATGSTDQHAHVAVDENNKIFVLDQGNGRIQVFDDQGGFLTMWGSSGTSSGQFQSAFGVVARGGQVIVVDSPGGNRQRLQQFTDSGELIKSYGWPTLLNVIILNERFAFSPDGLLATARSGIGGSNDGPLFDQSLNVIANLPRPSALQSQPSARLGGAFLPSGDFCAVNGPEVWILERRHASTDNPVVRNMLPQPEVIQSVQRAGSTLVDIDFKVIDHDSATVDVAALAFVDGGDTLADVLRVATLEEGTAANVGPGQLPNEVKRLTWNAAADWTTEFGEVQLEILAKDQRDLLGVHWVTVPASGSVPSFAASVRPIVDADWLSIWYWLIAKGEPGLALIDGEVKGVGGGFDGEVLASGVVTHARGRDFLYAKLGVRAITQPELNSLQSGNYGFASSSLLTLVRP